MFHGNRPQNPGEPVGRVLQERASSTVHQAPALRDDLRPERGQPTSDAGQEHPQHSLRLGPPLAELHRHARRRQRIPGGFRPGMLFSLSSGSRHPAEAGTPVHCLWPRRIQDGERPSAVPPAPVCHWAGLCAELRAPAPSQRCGHGEDYSLLL